MRDGDEVDGCVLPVRRASVVPRRFAEVQEGFLREGTAAVAEEGEDGGSRRPAIVAVGFGLEGEFGNGGGIVSDFGHGRDIVFVFLVVDCISVVVGRWFGREPG